MGRKHTGTNNGFRADLLYLDLLEEFGDLLAAQLLARLLVGADDLLHGHILG